jgi:hypothetical protein
VGVREMDRPSQLLKQNEFECLNLVITRPAHLTPDSRCPVMIWIHGGGDRGYGTHWVYDGGPLVRKSVQIGKPVIIIAVKYAYCPTLPLGPNSLPQLPHWPSWIRCKPLYSRG